MARREGLEHISKQIEKIKERAERERERRKNKNKPIRVQPRLPGMKTGGTLADRIRRSGRGVRPKDPNKEKRSPGRPGGKGKKEDKRKKIRYATPLAEGGITGKTTFGELSKRKPLKKGIRLKGKGSSFMKEYKKRVYNRAGGGSMNGGVRGTGIAIKGKNFKGVF
jgi:hypothetical protein